MRRLPRGRFTSIATTLLAGAQLVGCATATSVTSSAPQLARRADNCEVTVIDRGGTVASGRTAIATIESHLQRNLFFGGRVTLLEDAYKELRAKACELGGDEVRVDDFMETAAAEMTHVHVWATVFRRE